MKYLKLKACVWSVEDTYKNKQRTTDYDLNNHVHRRSIYTISRGIPCIEFLHCRKSLCHRINIHPLQNLSLTGWSTNSLRSHPLWSCTEWHMCVTWERLVDLLLSKGHGLESDWEWRNLYFTEVHFVIGSGEHPVLQFITVHILSLYLTIVFDSLVVSMH